MYEVWLMMNIVYEIMLETLALVLGALGLWLALMVVARRHLAFQTIRPSLYLGIAAAAILTLLLPSLIKSSFADMSYWVDWANLLGIAFAGGAGVVAFAWPILSLSQPSHR